MVHEKNEWNIEVVPKADIEPAAPSAAGAAGNPQQMNAIALPEGLSFSHVRMSCARTCALLLPVIRDQRQRKSLAHSSSCML